MDGRSSLWVDWVVVVAVDNVNCDIKVDTIESKMYHERVSEWLMTGR